MLNEFESIVYNVCYHIEWILIIINIVPIVSTNHPFISIIGVMS